MQRYRYLIGVFDRKKPDMVTSGAVRDLVINAQFNRHSAAGCAYASQALSGVGQFGWHAQHIHVWAGRHGARKEANVDSKGKRFF